MDRRLVYSLQKLPDDRSQQDLEVIARYLHNIDNLSVLRDTAIKRLSKVVYYEYHDGNTVLWREGDLCNSWYILITGSVFIEPSMYLPRSSFGKPNTHTGRRLNDCLILEPSEMIVLPTESANHTSLRNISDNQYKRNSRASDTSSSLYSADGDGPSVHDSSLLDSDDEDPYGNESCITDVVDQARECLEKNPEERTEDDIEILLEFLQNLPAFANMTMAIRRALCSVMVYAVVGNSRTTVMNDGEELDSWSVILNGRVQIQYNDRSTKDLHMGDSFGIKPTKEKEFHQGVMTTMVDDCQFVCIAQDDYYEILSAGEENTTKYEENGVVVLVTEKRVIEAEGRSGDIVISGTPDRLIKHLIQDRSTCDMTYDEDFLLTYRMFLKSPSEISTQLLKWFNDDGLRERITRVVLLWVNNHFNDFESDMTMTEFLQNFEDALEEKSMHAHLKFLHIACAAKARPRSVTLTRGTRDEILHFSILGGIDQHCGIFISMVEKGSKAYEGGLKRGDQILEVNGTNFEGISHSKALDVLRGTTLLSITVKSNLLGSSQAFKDMLTNRSENPNGGSAFAVKSAKTLIKITQPHNDDHNGDHQPKIRDRKHKVGTGGKTKLMKMLAKMTLMSNSKNVKLTNAHHDSLDSDHPVRGRSNSLSNGSPTLTRSNSSPDVSQGYGMDDSKNDIPEHVLKIYRADQSYKYFLVHRETTTRDVVMLALRQFGISDHSSELPSISCSNYSLCEVSVEQGGLVKQKRLPDTASNLAERIGVHSRYYLRNNMAQETLVPDEAAQDMTKETQFNFLSLNPMEVAMQLTLSDYKVFQDIEPTEYIDNLIGRDSRYGTDKLLEFEHLVNREMFWVPSVICNESSVFRRMKCIKHFIKIAKYCKEFKNFNSMFAILSGLNTGTVSRLSNTWEKLPNKYQKMFDDMMVFLDPTRNMARYRNLLSNASSAPPVIPIFPIVKKDLAFIELGNDTFVDELVNFEKMRMVAKEVRHIVGLASSQYIPGLMAPHSSAAAAGTFFSNLSAGNMSGVVTIRRKKRSSALLNHPKKMYDEAQMCRRVRAYLSALTVIEDEERLNDLSISCEGKARSEVGVTSSLGSTSSPTLSGSKLGASNPNAANKLMSLSEKSRPINHKHLEKMTSPTPTHKLMNIHPHIALTAKARAVDLTESSSVLSNRGGVLRKLSTASTMSRSSTCSQPSSSDKYVTSACDQRGSMLSEDHDSGHHSMCETNSQSSVSAASSQQPSPPNNLPQSVSSRHRVHGAGQVAAARPPDYQLAAQMAYLSRHHPSNARPDYYQNAGIKTADQYHEEGDDLEEVVSAV